MSNNDTTWYEAMAKAMKEREKCLNAIKRWNADLAQAESIIAQLAAKREVTNVKISGPGPEYATTDQAQEESLG